MAVVRQGNGRGPGLRPVADEMEVNRKAWVALAVAVALLVATEFALQLRAHLRFGQSVFNALASEKTYQVHPAFGVLLLRPRSVIKGSQAVIETNSLGLRSPEIGPRQNPGELRVAVLGASTAMGTYTRTNDQVLSYRMQHHLREKLGRTDVSVVNAAIAGHVIDEQRITLERVVAPLDVNLVVWYPGFNDVIRYCRPATPAARARPLSEMDLPPWVLTVDLITKNTVWLREAAAKRRDVLDPEALDIHAFESSVVRFLESARRSGLEALTVTTAWAFRPSMAPAEQWRLSESARYVNPCFDVEGLHGVFGRHNAVLAAESERHGYQVYRLDEQLAGGSANFADATHFSVAGTDLAARLIAEKIASTPALAVGRTGERSGAAQ